MDARYYNGSDDRHVPRSDGRALPDYQSRLDFEKAWCASQGKIHGRLTMTDLVAMERAWKEQPTGQHPRGCDCQACMGVVTK